MQLLMPSSTWIVLWFAVIILGVHIKVCKTLVWALLWGTLRTPRSAAQSRIQSAHSYNILKITLFTTSQKYIYWAHTDVFGGSLGKIWMQL